MDWIKNTIPLVKLFTNSFRQDNNITTEKIVEILQKIQNELKYIHSKNILVVDGNEFNYLIDNKQNVYITDFGTSLDKEFDLSEDEKKFMDMNSKLDRVYIYYNIISLYIYSCIYNPKIEQKYNLKAFSNSSVLPETLKLTKYLIKNIDLINEDLKMSKFQYKLIKKYRKIIIRYIRWKTKFKESKEIDKNNYYLDSL
jgi:serine/threonine protein kinase